MRGLTSHYLLFDLDSRIPHIGYANLESAVGVALNLFAVSVERWKFLLRLGFFAFVNRHRMQHRQLCIENLGHTDCVADRGAHTDARVDAVERRHDAERVAPDIGRRADPEPVEHEERAAMWATRAEHRRSRRDLGLLAARVLTTEGVADDALVEQPEQHQPGRILG